MSCLGAGFPPRIMSCLGAGFPPREVGAALKQGFLSVLQSEVSSWSGVEWSRVLPWSRKSRARFPLKDIVLPWISVASERQNGDCTQRPCIFSWPMMISNSVNEFFVAV